MHFCALGAKRWTPRQILAKLNSQLTKKIFIYNNLTLQTQKFHVIVCVRFKTKFPIKGTSLFKTVKTLLKLQNFSTYVDVLGIFVPRRIILLVVYFCDNDIGIILKY